MSVSFHYHEKPVANYDWNCTDYRSFGENLYLMILSLPIYEQDLFFPLFGHLISFSSIVNWNFAIYTHDLSVFNINLI